MHRVLACLVAASAVVLSAGVGPGAASRTGSDWCEGSILWRNAKQHAGEDVTVRGRIVAVNTPSSPTAESTRPRPTFISVGRPYPSRYRFTAVVWNDGTQNDMPVPWPDEADYLVGKKACFEGRVFVRDGVPRMRITHFDFVNGVFVQ